MKDNGNRDRPVNWHTHAHARRRTDTHTRNKHTREGNAHTMRKRAVGKSAQKIPIVDWRIYNKKTETEAGQAMHTRTRTM